MEPGGHDETRLLRTASLASFELQSISCHGKDELHFMFLVRRLAAAACEVEDVFLRG